MHSYVLEQELHPVFNELDRHGLLLNLKRIRGESNESYRSRLLDVMVHPASSTYLGLINGVTRELGLSIEPYLDIEFATVNDISIDPYPAVIFSGTKCVFYDDISTGSVKVELDRFTNTENAYTLGGLKTELEAAGNISITLHMPDDTRSMTVINASTVKAVTDEFFSVKGNTISLEYENIIEGTISITSKTLTHRVPNLAAVRSQGDYWIDLRNGIIRNFSAPGSRDKIRYSFCRNKVSMDGSPVIIHDIQSDDFQRVMFEQDTDENGNPVHGLPTAIGADIINELLTVVPVSWGK